MSVAHKRGWLILLSLSMASSALAADQRLVEAVARQDRAAAQKLLNERVDVNARRADGASALLWAAHWNDIDLVDRLLRAGADVNAANDHGVTPLALACENTSTQVVDKLLAGGANPKLSQTN